MGRRIEVYFLFVPILVFCFKIKNNKVLCIPGMCCVFQKKAIGIYEQLLS